MEKETKTKGQAMRELAELSEDLRARIGSGAVRARFKQKAWAFTVKNSYRLKRLLDIVVSLAALVALSPVFLVTALAIRICSPGPVFFAQTRVGRYGRHFKFYKFRSMYIDAEERKSQLMANNQSADGVIFKMKNDPRITPIGKFIRRMSIDELPQLVNVLKGDMALVGPRPPVPSEVKEYTLEDRKRLNVIPGITCIWQVSGRSDIPFHEQVRLDKEYIQHNGVWTDIKLLFKTVPAILTGKGAY